MSSKVVAHIAICAMFVFLVGLAPAIAGNGANTGKVKIHVNPKQAVCVCG